MIQKYDSDFKSNISIVKLISPDNKKHDTYETANVKWEVRSGQVNFTLKNGMKLNEIPEDERKIKYEVCLKQTSEICAAAIIEINPVSATEAKINQTIENNLFRR